MSIRVKRSAVGLGLCLIIAVAGSGAGPVGAQEGQSRPAPAAGNPASGAQAVSYSFRLGELREREATAAEHCKALGSGAALAGIDYSNSAEGAYYKARFECGAPARSDFSVSYRSGDFGKIKGEIEEYCRNRGAAEVKFNEEPAVSGSTSKGTFRCE
jgi:hypothetical protein